MVDAVKLAVVKMADCALMAFILFTWPTVKRAVCRLQSFKCKPCVA